MSIPAQGAVSAETMTGELPWHKDEWGNGSYLYQNEFGAVGFVDGPGSNPGCKRVIKVFGADRQDIRDRIASALAAPRADSDERTAGSIDRSIVAALNGINVVEAAEEYEFCPDEGSHTPTEFEKALLIDFAYGLMNTVHEAVRPLVSATPAQPAGAVPDSLRALSEAATKGEWYTESEKCDGSYGSGEDCGEGYLAYSILTDAEPRYGNPGVIAETSNSTLGVIHEESDEDGFTAWDETARANTAFIVAAVNHVRSLLASHPAGQSAGSGAEAMRAKAAEIARSNAAVSGDGELYIAHKIADEIEALPLTAPDSTRTGQAEADLDWAVARWRAEVENRPLQNVHRRALDTTWRQVIRRFGGDPDALIGPSHDELADASPALAARPAAPEAQGAERVRHVKRGTEYEVLHRGVELQVALTRPFCLGHLNLPALEEGNRLAIYRGADGKLWAREEGEFDDGRFVPAPPASSGQGGR